MDLAILDNPEFTTAMGATDPLAQAGVQKDDSTKTLVKWYYILMIALAASQLIFLILPKVFRRIAA